MKPISFVLAVGAAALVVAGASRPTRAHHSDPDVPLEIAKIFWEYNSSADDLGVQVSLDGEDWKSLDIKNPGGHVIFSVRGRGPYQELGLTELFFEGAEPALSEVPLDELLAKFPEGDYLFAGKTVDGVDITALAAFSHAIPAAPVVAVENDSVDHLRISWGAVTGHPPGFPDEPIDVVAYQVLVDPYQVIVPASVHSVTVTPEFVATLAAGTHPFEVLAIDRSGNQTITEGTFTK